MGMRPFPPMPPPKRPGESWTAFVARMEEDRAMLRQRARDGNPLRRLVGWIIGRDLTPEPPPLPRRWAENAAAEQRGEAVGP